MSDVAMNSQWKKEKTRCLLWRFVPVFGFFSYFWMAEHSRRMHYRKQGILFGVMSILALLLSSPLLEILANIQITRYNSWVERNTQVVWNANLLYTLNRLGGWLVIVLWLVIMINVSLQIKNYLGFCAFREKGLTDRVEMSDEKTADDRTTDGKGQTQALRKEQAAPVLREIPALAATEMAAAPQSRIDINTATQTQLQTLPGIDAALALRILEHRERQGAFASVDEFLDAYRVKPHFAVQIRDLAFAGSADRTPMTGSRLDLPDGHKALSGEQKILTGERPVSGSVKRRIDI